MLLSCILTSGGSENLGGGGGGIVLCGGGGGRVPEVLGGGGGIPLDDAWINFLGAGMVDIFLTIKSSDCPLGFRGSNSCNGVRMGETKNPTTKSESDILQVFQFAKLQVN